MIESRTYAVQRSSNVRWHIVVLMFFASFVAYILRTNMSIVGETMMKDIGIDEIQLGMIFSAFAWGYAIFQFPGGIYSEAVGSRKAMASIALAWGILTALNGMIPGNSVLSVTAILMLLIALRFLVGATQAPLFPIVGLVICDWFPVGGWGLPNGFITTGLTLGAAATGPLMVWLVAQEGWRGSFFWIAPLGFLTAAAWWLYVRDYPHNHTRVNRKELELINTNRGPAKEVRAKGIWKIALKNRDILFLMLSYFSMNYVFYLFFSWLFYYLADIRKFPAQEAGIMNSMLWIVGAIGASLGGFLCDSMVKKFGVRRGYRMVPVPALILSALLLFAGALSANAYIALALFSLSFGLTQLTDSAYWAAAISIGDRHGAAAAGGILNTGGNVVGGLGALLVPITAKYFGWTTAIATGSVFALAAAILFLFVRADVSVKFDAE